MSATSVSVPETGPARPRAVLLRGAGLSASEMAYYAPLRDEFDLLAVGTTEPNYAKGIPIPVETPEWPDEEIWRKVVPGGKTHSVFNWAMRRIGGVRYSLPGLGRILENARIVHALEIRPGFTYQAARAKARLGYRLVTSVSENIPCPVGDTPDDRVRIRRVIGLVDRFVALTDSARAALMLEGAPAAKIRVIPHGVDESLFSPDPTRTGEEIDLLFVGRFSPEKGAADLLAAMAMLSQEGRSVTAALIGDGPEKEHLLARASEWRLRVSFVPWIDRSLLPDWYRRARIVVIPSLAMPGIREQFSFAALEAMACARPVVAAAVGALPEVIGKAGALVHAGSPRTLAAEIAVILADDSRRALLGETARKRVLDRYTLGRSAKALRELYRELVREGASGEA